MITAPYGSWVSPLSARAAANAGTRFAGLAIDPRVNGGLWWAESRPTEGRTALVAGVLAGVLGGAAVGDAAVGQEPAVADVGPSWLRARTRVNEYGGGAFWLGAEHIYWVDERSQCIVRLRRGPGSAPGIDVDEVTPPSPEGTIRRFAAGVVTPDERWIVCERERHIGVDQDPLVLNELVAVDIASGAEHLLVSEYLDGGGDFVAAPRVSPDGRSLAWLRWDHPDMPWDAAELWAAELSFGPDGVRLDGARRVAGGLSAGAARGLDRAVSVSLPEWAPDGHLWWCDDTDDWWHLRRAVDAGVPGEGAGDHLDPVVPDAQEEVGEPRWVAGGSRYGFTGDGRVVFAAASEGTDSIRVFDPSTGAVAAWAGHEFTSVEHLVVAGDRVGVVGGSPDRPTSVWLLDLDDSGAVDLRSPASPLRPEWISRPVPVTFPTEGDSGAVAHALFYPPVSGDHVAPDGESPPLVVRIHGGPTAAARSEFSTSVQFWTTRGFAVADVNYRGSTGYGRRYRDLLRGRWGDADVDDCIAVTAHLAATGRVDPERCVIRGGSSGGFTALAALCFQAGRGAPGAFSAACSLYGVTDLAALASDTHKFESRYLDGLVGVLPDDAEVYRSRSPLFHAEQLDRPVLLLQGAEDRVVPPSQAEVLVDALVANGVPHTYVLFEGEGHGFHNAATVVQALETELAFYGAVLEFEPAGLDGRFTFQ